MMTGRAMVARVLGRGAVLDGRRGGRTRSGERRMCGRSCCHEGRTGQHGREDGSYGDYRNTKAAKDAGPSSMRPRHPGLVP